MDTCQHKLVMGEVDRFVSPARPVIDAEGDVDQKDIKAEETEHRPCPHHQEHQSCAEADQANDGHQNHKAGRAERSVRGKQCPKALSRLRHVDVLSHDRQSIPAFRAGCKLMDTKSRFSPPARKAKATKRKAAKLTQGEINEIFRRFAAAMPSPKTELEYVNPYTLLVAVVLSAQATDAGVNKATRALFKIA